VQNTTYNLPMANCSVVLPFGNPWICTRKAGRKSRVNAPLPRPEKERGKLPSKAKKLKSQKTATRKFWQVARTLVRVDVCVNTKFCIVIVKNFHSGRRQPAGGPLSRGRNRSPATVRFGFSLTGRDDSAGKAVLPLAAFSVKRSSAQKKDIFGGRQASQFQI